VAQKKLIIIFVLGFLVQLFLPLLCTGQSLIPGISAPLPESPPISIVNDSDVRLRAIPSVLGQKLGLLQKGDKVAVLRRSATQFEIDGHRDYWYNVKTGEQEIGWMFGEFLEKNGLNSVKAIKIEPSGTFVNASIEVWDDDPTEKRYHILLVSGNYDFKKRPFEQTDKSVELADIAVASKELKSGKFLGDYEAGFKSAGKDIIDSKVKEPVYIVLDENKISIDTMGNLYEGGIHLTENLKLMHFSGSYNWIGEKR